MLSYKMLLSSYIMITLFYPVLSLCKTKYSIDNLDILRNGDGEFKFSNWRKSKKKQKLTIAPNKFLITNRKKGTFQPFINKKKTTFTNRNKFIPITKGRQATITQFTDSVFQCISGPPPKYALAINPLLLGFTVEQWKTLYANADPSKIPWCNLKLTLTINGKSFTGTIIDTCDPVGNPFADPNTGDSIGGKCDYDNVIDLHGEEGLNFLQESVNDDFYDGPLEWTLI